MVEGRILKNFQHRLNGKLICSIIKPCHNRPITNKLRPGSAILKCSTRIRTKEESLSHRYRRDSHKSRLLSVVFITIRAGRWNIAKNSWRVSELKVSRWNQNHWFYFVTGTVQVGDIVNITLAQKKNVGLMR